VPCKLPIWLICFVWNGIHIVYISICSSWYEFDNPDKGNLSQKLLKPHSIGPEVHLSALVLYCECSETISVSAWTPRQPVGYSMFCRRRNKFRAFVMRAITIRPVIGRYIATWTSRFQDSVWYCTASVLMKRPHAYSYLWQTILPSNSLSKRAKVWVQKSGGHFEQ
jgi:hypothetical protein